MGQKMQRTYENFSMVKDPIFQAITSGWHDEFEVGKWYFFTETWSDTEGPYDTKEEAQKELESYVKEVLGERVTD